MKRKELLTNINAGNITGAYGDANVAAYLPTYTGNLAGGNLSVSGNITATANVQAGNLRTAGLISATGTITGANISAANLIGM